MRGTKLTYFFLLTFSAALLVLPETSLGVVAWRKINQGFAPILKRTNSEGGYNYLDDTNVNSLPPVPDGEHSQGRELSKELDNGRAAGLDELGGVLAGVPVHLLQGLGELAGNVAVRHRRVAVGHLGRKWINQR